MIKDFLGSRKWKEKMHYSIKAQLNEMIKRSRSHEEVYKSASNPTAAQIWCALAELATDVKFIELRLKRIEEALKQPRKEISKDLEGL
ncbi:MAG: hypothetical protein KKB25_02350 [Nanoarchaeota archaeon]|nr:hypothetical protein [Nanoarchaeota archaeon]